MYSVHTLNSEYKHRNGEETKGEQECVDTVKAKKKGRSGLGSNDFLCDGSNVSAAFKASRMRDIHSFGANAAIKEEVNEYE